MGKKSKSVMKRRPEMDDEIFDDMIENIRQGVSLRKMCLDPKKEWPTTKAWYRYLDEDPARGVRYARAKEDGIEAKVDSALHIAMTMPDVQRARLVVDTIKWEASKLKPTKYNDKFIHEHSGPGGGPMEIKNVYEGITEENMEEIDSED